MKSFVKGLISGAVIIGALVGIVACAYNNSESRDAATVDQQQTIYGNNQPIPLFDFSMPRDILIQIYKLKNTKISTYTVFLSNSGQVLFTCPSLGYPIEGGTELTNPLQISGRYVNSSNGYVNGTGVIGQADPDGLYHPGNSLGTYVLCVRQNGDTVPVYAEPYVMTFPFQVTTQTPLITDNSNSQTTAKVDVSRAPKVITPSASPTP